MKNHELLAAFAEASEELLSALSLSDMTHDVRNAYVLLNNVMDEYHHSREGIADHQSSANQLDTNTTSTAKSEPEEPAKTLPFGWFPEPWIFFKHTQPGTTALNTEEICMKTTTFPLYNIVRWPDANGHWWLVSERSETSGYSPIKELNPHWTKGRDLEPTYANQLYRAAELLSEKGLDALTNPHAMIGQTCGCGDCFCCAANEIVKAVTG